MTKIVQNYKIFVSYNYCIFKSGYKLCFFHGL